MTWGYRTPQEAAEKKKPWINARIEKALTGRYFRHMFREGRVIIPAAVGLNGRLKMVRSSHGISYRRTGEPIFMAGVTISGRTFSKRLNGLL
jgi:putative SOS response-associated peptidase YedK